MADNITLNPGALGAAVATDDISSTHYQRIKLVHGVDGTNDGDVAKTNPLPIGKYFSTRSDTYTTTANGTQVDASSKPCSKFSLQVKGTGASATAWNVLLEGSLDGTNYTTILQHSSANPLGANADGATVWMDAGAPFLYFRSRSAATLTLGSATNIIATIAGMQ